VYVIWGQESGVKSQESGVRSQESEGSKFKVTNRVTVYGYQFTVHGFFY